MILLDAVNGILPKLGEHPVTSLSGRHSTVALITEEIKRQINKILQRGWWFNEYQITLTPDTNSLITLPTDAIAFRPNADQFANVVVRGRKLFNIDTQNYVWATPLKGTIKVKMGFEDLPDSAAEYVWYSALCVVFVSDIGLSQDMQAWEAEKTDAMATMEAEHLDQKNYSTAATRRYTRIRRAMFG